MPYRDDINLPGVVVYEYNEAGEITRCSGRTLSTTAGYFAVGCKFTIETTGKEYYNAGTKASPSWNSVSETTHSERVSLATVTATDDGLTTGLIPAGTTFASITSAGATKAVTLPAITSAGIGQTIDLYVGANGYELLTPASSNNTINTVDSDGTNQLDVAANTLLRCVQVSATGWVCYQVAATTITVVAPDND